jgi:sphingomyelin phosphodiesterase
MFKLYIIILYLFFIKIIYCNQDFHDGDENNKIQKQLKIMSHNIFIMSGIAAISQNYNTKQRIEEMKKASYWKNMDVLVFQEAFNEDLIKDFKNELYKNGYIYQTQILGNPKDLINLNGGVFIVSKLNFEKEYFEIYEKSCGTDNFSNKGFIHIKINLDNILINIIGTHTQSDDNLCLFNNPKNIRFKQLSQLNNYINKNIESNEIILLIGDLNIDKGSNEYHEMLKLYNFNPPIYDNDDLKSTLDNINNSIAKDRYSGLKSEYLDYVFIKKNNYKNINLNQKALKIKSNNYEWKNKKYSDFSDHYPIFSNLTFI